MAKTVEKEEVVVEAKPEKGARDARWAAFLEKYKAQNPVCYARLADQGVLKTIPESFQ